MDIPALITIGFAFFVVAISPGPATISNATLAMSKGRKVSLVYSAGLSSGLLFWGLIAASGMGVILQGSVYLLSILKIFGGLYLLWLAHLSFRSSMNPGSASLAKVGDDVLLPRWYLRGLALNLSNPKSVIAWMAALSMGMGVNGDLLFLVAAVLVCTITGFVVNGLYSIVFSIDGVMQSYKKCGRWVDGVVSGLFGLAGFALIKSAFTRT